MTTATVAELRSAELLSPRQQALRDLLLMSETILGCAQQEQWLDALPLQQQRRRAMTEFFEQACSDSEAELVAAVIEAILAVDAQVSELLHSQRSSLLDQGAARRRNTTHLNRYIQHS